MGKNQSKTTQYVSTSLLVGGALAKVNTEERIMLIREEIEGRGLSPRLFTDVINFTALIAYEETFKRTLLMYAYIMTEDHGLRLAMVQSLLEQGVDPFECDTEGRTFLHYVVRHKKFMSESGFQVMYMVLDKEHIGRSIDTPDIEGMTVFHEACKQLVTSETLVESSRDNMDTKDTWTKWRNILDTLLSVGADINTKNLAGKTCLHTLLMYRKGRNSISEVMQDIICYLLENQIDITLTDHSGLTAYQRVEKPVSVKVQLAILFAKAGLRSFCVKADASLILGDVLCLSKQEIQLMTWSNMYQLFNPVVTYFQLGVNPDSIPSIQRTMFWEILISCLLRVSHLAPFILEILLYYGLRCHLTLSHIKEYTTDDYHDLETVLQVCDDMCTYSQQYICSLQVLAARVIRLVLYPNALIGVSRLTLPGALKNFIVPEQLGLTFE